jgi:tetratricopeptide (TPR) repeat protein
MMPRIPVVVSLCLILLCSILVIRPVWGSTTTTTTPTNSILSQLKQKAHILYNNEKDVQALSLFKQILHLTPHDAETLTNMGNLENDLPNFTGGMFYFQKALNYDHKHIGALLGIGDSLEGLGNHSAALIYYKEAASTPIPVKQQHIKLGLVEQVEKANALTHLGNYSRALSIDDTILKQNATNQDALGSKGAVLLEMKNDTAALAIFNQIRPPVPWILDNEAKALTELKNYSGAIYTSNAALKLDPRDSYAWYNKALALLDIDLQGQQHSSVLTLKDLDTIFQNLSKVLEINPHDPYALRLEAKLTNGIEFEYIKS